MSMRVAGRIVHVVPVTSCPFDRFNLFNMKPKFLLSAVCSLTASDVYKRQVHCRQAFGLPVPEYKASFLPLRNRPRGNSCTIASHSCPHVRIRRQAIDRRKILSSFSFENLNIYFFLRQSGAGLTGLVLIQKKKIRES